MADRRRGGHFWKNETVAAGAESGVAAVGLATNVALFMRNDGATATDITVQCNGAAEVTAGRNAAIGVDDWYDYVGASGTDVITVAPGANVCFDLTPFAPANLRLVSSAATTLTAFVIGTG